MSHSELRIRPALPAESAEVARIMRTAFADHRGRIRPESAALKETAQSVARLIAEGRVFVADCEGRLAGCVSAAPEGEHVYLGRLSVLPEFRRRGIANRLLEAAEDYARETGLGAVLLKVRVALPENQAFFRARGYREIGREAHPGFDHPTSIRMEKRLSAR